MAAGLVALVGLQARKALAREAMAASDTSYAVRQLRIDGRTWAQIGRHLGITRQGARQHYKDPAERRR